MWPKSYEWKNVGLPLTNGQIDKGSFDDFAKTGYTLFAKRIPEVGLDGFMNTWGLPEAYGHPNFMATHSQNLDLHHIVLDELAQRVRQGKKFADGDWIEDILEGKAGFTIKLVLKSDFLHVVYYDMKGENPVKVELPKELLDSFEEIRANKEAE